MKLTMIKKIATNLLLASLLTSAAHAATIECKGNIDEVKINNGGKSSKVVVRFNQKEINRNFLYSLCDLEPPQTLVAPNITKAACDYYFDVLNTALITEKQIGFGLDNTNTTVFSSIPGTCENMNLGANLDSALLRVTLYKD